MLGFENRIDDNGDADGNYSLLALKVDQANSKMEPVGVFEKAYNSELPELHLQGKIEWLSDKVPKDEIKCGFNNERCRSKFDPLIVIIIGIFGLILFISFYLLFRHYRYEHKLESKLWKVDFKEILVLNLKKNQSSQDVKNAIQVSLFLK